MATEVMVALVTALVSVIGALSGFAALVANHKRTNSEAAENDATAAQIITKAAGEAIQMQIAAAEAQCRELIRKAIEESEARCREQLAQLKHWGEQQALEACEARRKMQEQIDFLTNRLAERDELLAERESELRQLAEEAREGR